MNESISRRIWKTDRAHKNSARLVLLALAECIDNDNHCPSIATLSEMAQVTPASVRHALSELEADKTVTIGKQAGKSEKGGRTNCYTINFLSGSPDAVPVDPDPAKVLEGKENNPLEIPQGKEKHSVEFYQGTKIPQGENLDPDLPVEYARAADAKKESGAKELKELDTNLTNSLNVIVPDTPAQSEKDLEDSLKNSTPEVRALYDAALSKANRPDNAHQDTPNPGSAPPLPPDVEQEYLDHFAKSAVVPKERDNLIKLLGNYGRSGLIAFITTAPLLDSNDDVIRNPAAYMRTMKPGQKPAHGGRSYSQDNNPSGSTDDDPVFMKFPGFTKFAAKETST